MKKKKKKSSKASVKISLGPFHGDYKGVTQELIDKQFTQMMHYRYAYLIAGIIMAVCGVKYLLVYAGISLPEIISKIIRWIKAKLS